MPLKKMEPKAATLETEVAGLRTAKHAMQLTAEENHEKLVVLLSKNNSDSNGESSPMKLSAILHGDTLDEFRKSVKKVELPMFAARIQPGGSFVWRFTFKSKARTQM